MFPGALPKEHLVASGKKGYHVEDIRSVQKGYRASVGDYKVGLNPYRGGQYINKETLLQLPNTNSDLMLHHSFDDHLSRGILPDDRKPSVLIDETNRPLLVDYYRSALS